jgi:hypothetical protein
MSIQGYTIVDEGRTNVSPGDYLKYVDEWGKVIGCGVLLKVIVSAAFPRTKSYYVLKNIQTQSTWKVLCGRYQFYVKPAQNGHIARNIRFREALLNMVNDNLT